MAVAFRRGLYGSRLYQKQLVEKVTGKKAKERNHPIRCHPASIQIGVTTEIGWAAPGRRQVAVG
jgi:hypothetical protein